MTGRVGGPYVWSMMPQNQSPRKRPYVLMPPTEIPTGSETPAAMERALAGEASLELQVAFQEAAAVTPPEPTAIPQFRGESSALGGVLGTMVLSAMGALAGNYLAVQQTQDVLIWSVAGGAAGFVLGGVCLLWNRRKD